MKIVEVYKEIQDQQMNIVSKYYFKALLWNIEVNFRLKRKKLEKHVCLIN